MKIKCTCMLLKMLAKEDSLKIVYVSIFDFNKPLTMVTFPKVIIDRPGSCYKVWQYLCDVLNNNSDIFYFVEIFALQTLWVSNPKGLLQTSPDLPSW